MSGAGAHHHDHGGHNHDLSHDGHHAHGGPLARARELLFGHSHDAAEKLDAALEGSADGLRAVRWSLAVEFGITTTKPELKGWITTLQRLAPKRITLIGEKLQLEASPERVLEALAMQHSALPAEIRSAYMDHWLATP